MRTPRRAPTWRVLALTLPAALLAAGCTQNTTAGTQGGEGAGGDVVSVSSTDDACQVSTRSAPAGPITFRVTNDGGEVTEFYLYDQTDDRIVGEVENIGPGLTRDLVVSPSPGRYETACKPGMTGDGIRATFTVTAAGASG